MLDARRRAQGQGAVATQWIYAVLKVAVLDLPDLRRPKWAKKSRQVPAMSDGSTPGKRASTLASVNSETRRRKDGRVGSPPTIPEDHSPVQTPCGGAPQHAGWRQARAWGVASTCALGCADRTDGNRKLAPQGGVSLSCESACRAQAGAVCVCK